MNYSFLITFGFAFGAMVCLSRKIEGQLHQLRKELMPNVEIDSTKYGVIAYEHFCLGNNIPPDWNGLEIEQQESWIELADAVILQYKCDATIAKSQQSSL